jgi:protease-4
LFTKGSFAFPGGSSMHALVRPRWFALAAAVFVFASAAAPASAARLAHIALKGAISETAPEFSLAMFGGAKPTTLRELLARIRSAKTDAKVDGLILSFQGAGLGYAQAQDVRASLADFRRSGKKVYVYFESADMHEYLAATGADNITAMPSGDLDFRGMAMELMHYKGLLDKLGIEADFLKMGRYKGAAEPMTEAKPSPATLEAMNVLLDDLFNTFVEGVASGRRLTVEQVKKLIDDGPYTSEEALTAKLVDRVAHWENFKSELRQELGNLTILENYGKKSAAGPAIDFDNPLSMFKLFSELMGPRAAAVDNSPKIVVIYAEGAIMSGESGQSLFGGQTCGSVTLTKAFRQAREDASVKAVVLRIDSPGGSALASDAIWKEVQLTARAKPVIASMGNIAASGGYYIASGASVIVAEPSTLTGSIGVIGGKLVLKGLFDKLDITVERLNRGRNAGLFSSSTKFSDSERAVFGRHMQKIYDNFIDRVSSGRNMERADVLKVAEGRVWSGLSAHKHKLVDELGGLDHSISLAAERGRVRDYKIEVLPKPKTFMDLLSESFFGGGDTRINLAAGAQARLLGELFPRSLAPMLRQMEFVRMMERERVMTVLPFAVTVE